MATQTKNLNLNIFDFATDSTQDFVNGIAGLQNSNMHKIDEAITDKVKIDNETVNINFTSKQLVQNGIISELPSEKRDDFTIITSINNSFPSGQGIINILDITYYTGYMVQCFEVEGEKYVRLIYGNGKQLNHLFDIKDNKFNVKNGVETVIIFMKKDNFFYLSINGNILINQVYNDYVHKDIRISIHSQSKKIAHYNHILKNSEIQHNLSVLNNTPSISHINNYAISTDTDHVQDRTGRVQENINRVFYKQSCKEFTSDGSSIAVNNGMDGYLLSGKIEGQTIKNYILGKKTTILISGTGSEFSNRTTSTNYAKISFSQNVSNLSWVVYYFQEIESFIQPSTKYKFLLKIKNNLSATTNCYIQLNNSSATNLSSDSINFKAQDYKDGIYTFELTTAQSLNIEKGIGGYVRLPSSWGENEFFEIELLGVIDASVNSLSIKSQLPFGLLSNQAIIYNNNLKYSFYSPIISGKTRIMKATKGSQSWVEINANETRDIAKYDYKLESTNGDLGSVSSAYDYIDRARKIKVQNTVTEVFDGSDDEGWFIDTTYNSVDTLCRFAILKPIKSGVDYGNYIYCDKFVNSQVNTTLAVEAISSNNTENKINIKILKSKLTSPDKIGFKTWLQANPISVCYQLTTPIEVSMTDTEIKAYDTHRETIDLGGLEGARNTLEIMEDGSAIYTQNTYEVVVGENSDYVTYASSNAPWDEKNQSVWHNNITLKDWKIGQKFFISDKYKCCTELDRDLNAELIQCHTTNNGVYIQIDRNKMPISTKETFEAYMKTNPIKIRYQINTPIVTQIPKELVPTITTQLQNEFRFDDAVVPYRATIQVPINKVLDLETRLAQLEKVIASTSNISLFTNYVDDEYNNNQNKESEMF